MSAKPYSIKKTEKPIIRFASRASIESYFDKLQAPLRELTWLEAKNRYRKNCTSKFEADAKSPHPFTKHQIKNLMAYVGASSPAHVIDGWSFLGRSVDSALRCDPYSAAHFAYYAELRAAMSILASEGIGVFSGIHAILGDKEAKRFPVKGMARTHSVIWPLLRYWSTLKRCSDLFDELIRPEQIPVSSWLKSRSTYVPVRAIGQQWLSAWGIDLATTREDHSTRNMVSYRPSAFRPTPSYGATNIAEFVSSLWKLFEPGIGRRFQQIERHLVKRACRTGPAAPPTQNEIASIGIGTAEAANWAAFISSTDEPLPLSLAQTSVPIEDATCHLRMISRAALLLFLASGSTRQLLGKAGYSPETISFWWRRFGEERGLWNPNDEPDDPLDKWADVTTAIDELASWGQSNPNAALREVTRSQHKNIHELGAFELVGIWSILP